MKNFGLAIASALLLGSATMASAQTAPNENQAPSAATADQGQSNSMAGQPPGEEIGRGNAPTGISNGNGTVTRGNGTVTTAPGGTANRVATATPHRGNHRHLYKKHFGHRHPYAMTKKKHARTASANTTKPVQAPNGTPDAASPDTTNTTQPR